MGTEIMPPNRGDSFDLTPRRTSHGWDYGDASEKTPQALIASIISNPSKLVGNVDEKQLQNIRGAVVALGAFGVHRFLSGFFGDTIAGMIGGGLSGFVAGKVFPRSVAQQIERAMQRPETQERFQNYFSQPPQQPQQPQIGGPDAPRDADPDQGSRDAEP